MPCTLSSNNNIRTGCDPIVSVIWTVTANGTGAVEKGTILSGPVSGLPTADATGVSAGFVGGTFDEPTLDLDIFQANTTVINITKTIQDSCGNVDSYDFNLATNFDESSNTPDQVLSGVSFAAGTSTLTFSGTGASMPFDVSLVGLNLGIVEGTNGSTEPFNLGDTLRFSSPNSTIEVNVIDGSVVAEMDVNSAALAADPTFLAALNPNLSFVGLPDAPTTYTGAAGQLIRVNAGETGVEFFDIPVSGVFDQVNGLDLTLDGSNQVQVAFDFTELANIATVDSANDRIPLYDDDGAIHGYITPDQLGGNIYTTDGSLTNPRTLSGDDNSLTFNLGNAPFSVDTSNGSIVGAFEYGQTQFTSRYTNGGSNLTTLTQSPTLAALSSGELTGFNEASIQLQGTIGATVRYVYNGVNAYELTADTDGVKIVTENIVNSSATVGQVPLLQDPLSGEIEYGDIALPASAINDQANGLDITLNGSNQIEVAYDFTELANIATIDSDNDRIALYDDDGAVHGYITPSQISDKLADVAATATANNVDVAINTHTRVLTADAADTVTLPTGANAIEIGCVVEVFNASGNELVLAKQVADNYLGTPSTVIPANSGFTARLVAANTWEVLGTGNKASACYNANIVVADWAVFSATEDSVLIPASVHGLGTGFKNVQVRGLNPQGQANRHLIVENDVDPATGDVRLFQPTGLGFDCDVFICG